MSPDTTERRIKRTKVQPQQASEVQIEKLVELYSTIYPCARMLLMALPHYRSNVHHLLKPYFYNDLDEPITKLVSREAKPFGKNQIKSLTEYSVFYRLTTPRNHELNINNTIINLFANLYTFVPITFGNSLQAIAPDQISGYEISLIAKEKLQISKTRAANRITVFPNGEARISRLPESRTEIRDIKESAPSTSVFASVFVPAFASIEAGEE